MPAFNVPGLDFFATSGESLCETERVGTWFRQIIPTGCQLICFLEGIQNKCIELTEFMEDDSPDGRITSSSKGFHFAPRCPWEITTSSTHSSFICAFDDDVFLTSLTQRLQPPQSDVVSMLLNAFAHATGLEVGSFFDTSAPPISVKTREHKGEPSDLTVRKIPVVLVGNGIGKVARIRRAS